jgi:hypothetical protein
MICLMHEGSPYGHLKVGSKDIGKDILARITGCSVTDCEKWLSELLESGVCSKHGDTIVCRRMLRDERVRNARAAGGGKSLDNPNVPRVRISLDPSLGVSPASAVASASALKSESNTRARAGKKLNGHDVEKPELPDWIPALQWQGWIEARTKARHPPTNLALRMAIAKLAHYHEAGHNIAQILAQSAMNNWSDLYEPKG